jgi:ATP-binding cassette subfamily B protein
MKEGIGYIRSKISGALAQLPYLPRALALVWSASKALTAVWVVLLVVQGLLPIATVYLTRSLVNWLAAAVRAGGSRADIRPGLVIAAMMAAVLLAAEILRSITTWIRTAQSELVQDHINDLIHEKSLAADLAFYETPDFYDHLHRAKEEAGYRPVALLENLGGLFQSSVTLVGMAGVLIPYGIWLPAALLAGTLPALYAVFQFTLRQHRWRMRTTADQRRTWYYDWLLTSGDAAAELRLFALGFHFRWAYRILRCRLRNEHLDLRKDQAIASLGAGVLGLAITGSVLAWAGWRTLQGKMSLGDMALLYQALNYGQLLLQSLIENTGQIYSNVLFLGNLFEFLDLRSTIVDSPRPAPAPTLVRSGIIFDGVRFRYPASERAVFQDFNLVIPAGRVTAIVGPNGSGKSTLIKLLCRFYDPDAGRIEIDGVDIRELSTAELRSRISVLFQTPVHYSATAGENIALGNLAASPGIDDIKAATRASGAEEIIAQLPRGYDNMLGRWFEGGAELSVGEWQRIALARAFLRRAPIILLDEPTSAMDMWAEADWMERFKRLAEGSTALIITHRLTTAMRADTIHVIAEGRIVESGTHGRLLALGGRYAQAWTAQMESCV